MDLTPQEQRVLGCLLEKQRTTPDQYPLSLNALRLACNQSTNRDPVVDYDEPTIRSALERLSRRRWVRYASSSGSRAAKYRHLVDEALEISVAQQAVLCVLLLRGAQTPGELKQRTERMHHFDGLDDLHTTLDGLAERELVRRIGRRPGQKEDRWEHLLGDDEALDISSAAPYQEQTPAPSAAYAAGEASDVSRSGSEEGRIAALEAQVRALRDELDALRSRFDQLSG
jgi:uncharacterized protein YceH (UPF0502 family)